MSSVVAEVMHNVASAMPAHEVARRIRAASHWLVRSGDNVVGPVSIELIERGLDAGKIPEDAEMAYAGGGEWRLVAEVFGLTPAAEERPPSLLPPVSVRYPEDPISIPRHGVVTALFGRAC